MAITVPRNILIYAALTLVAVGGGVVDSRNQTAALEERTTHAREKACDYDNVFRADKHLQAQTPSENVHTETIFRVLNCAETVKQEKGVPLSASQQAEFISLVDKGLLPTVKDGKVTGATVFPPAPPEITPGG